MTATCCVPRFLVGRSSPMRALFRDIKAFAPTKDALLIRGETGTGKDLTAREIHAESSRSSNAFVALNCSSLAEGTADSELFGSERGAYTDAEKRAGLFGKAHQGTLFLDEVGDLTLPTQGKLLRALQDGKVRSVGGEERMVDVRIVAATNRPLEEMVEKGRFRADLLRRFVEHLYLPPLRERPEDLEDIVAAIIMRERSCAGRNGQASSVSTEMIGQFRGYHWPGNVRELENHLKRALTRTRDSGRTTLELCDFSPLSPPVAPARFSDAERALRVAAEAIIGELRDGVRPAMRIPEIVDIHPGLDLAAQLANAFLESSWPNVDAAAQQLFSYANAEGVRMIKRRRKPAAR